MTRHATAALALGLLPLLACGDSTPRPLTFDLALDPSACTPVCASPDDCPLGCAGEIGVFALDDDGAPLAQTCLPFHEGRQTTLRALGTLIESTRLAVPSSAHARKVCDAGSTANTPRVDSSGASMRTNHCAAAR